MKAVLSSHALATSCRLHASFASAVLSNILSKLHLLGTLPTSQSAMPRWLKATALLSVSSSVVTELVSQASSELKARALKNVFCMFVTLLVSQTSAWLKTLAKRNVSRIVVTELVSQTSG